MEAWDESTAETLCGECAAMHISKHRPVFVALALL
jgi:hypothetical protein